MSGFVVCQACGTRIKAGRGHCLKCFAPLPDSEDSVPPPLSESLGLSRNVQMGIWVGATLAATLLAFAIWQTWPVPGDDIAQPADPASVAAAPRAPAPAPASPDDAASRPAAESSSAAAVATTPAAAEPNLETVRADYEQKLGAQPKDPVLLNKLGEVLERMGQVDEAATRFARAVALQPLEATYRINLARAAGQLGQMQRSIDQYREAARLRPRDYEVLNALASRFRRTATTRPQLRSSRRRGEPIRRPRELSWDWPPASKRWAGWTRPSMYFINTSTCRRVPLRWPRSKSTSPCFRVAALR